jgi:hypothetical protein
MMRSIVGVLNVLKVLGVLGMFAQAGGVMRAQTAQTTSSPPNAAQAASPPTSILTRRYQEGERLHYLMKGRNNDRPFEVRITGVVKRDADGRFVEEFAWSDLAWGGTAQPMTEASRDFRQIITLSGGAPFAMPNLSRIQPGLIGPVTDLLTFYADLFLASHAGHVREPGDKFMFPSPMINSWADGMIVVIGQGEIDFDITLTRVDKAAGTATVMVKHVPPKTSKLKLPAEWMRTLVADAVPNWVQVRRNGTTYVAAAGRETFDVELTVSLTGGEILSATQDNIVDAMARDCTTAELTDCGPPRPYRTVRRIEMELTSR